jgi:hypothetical protein
MAAVRFHRLIDTVTSSKFANEVLRFNATFYILVRIRPTACGDGPTDQESGREPVIDTSSSTTDLSNVFGNQAGSLGGAGAVGETTNTGDSALPESI